ncbi:MAG TPA: ABC transporter permease [Thermoanaerobaculia bacterium]|jgi:putative ABC transport system permease protein
MESFKRDLLFSLRGLARRPGFTVIAILTLALGIGANAAIFSTVYGVLLSPLPYSHPDRLTALWAQWRKQDTLRVSHTGGDFQTYRREARRSFVDFGAVGSVRQNLTGGGEPAQVQVGWISRNFFSVLGVRPVLGRDFTAAEKPDSLLIGNEFWHRCFGGDPGVLGRVVQLDGRPFTVVGVLPPGFRLHMAADVGISTKIDVWKPPDEARAKARWVTSELNLSSLRIIGRLRPGATLAQGQAEMDGIADQLRAQFPDHAEVGFHIDVQPLHREVVGHIERPLLILQGAVALVLLIACLNVANLLLVRAQNRQREIALRLSLGSGLREIARQMLTEALALAVLGGALGILLAYWGIRLLVALKPANFPRIEGIGINGPVLAFALGVTLLAALLAGLLPVLRIRRWNLNDILKEQSSQARGRDSWLSKALVVVEVALSLVLLLGAGLLLRSFARLQEVRPGFDSHNLLTFSITLPAVRYQDTDKTANFLAGLESQISRLPGVTSAATIWPLPLEGQVWYAPYRNPDRPSNGQQLLADYRLSSPDYPKTIGARLLEGRYLRDTDTHAMLVDQRFARENWPGRSALGHTVFITPQDKEEPFQVVGVVENIRHKDLRSDGRETLYVPTRGWAWANWELCLIVRTTSDPHALIGPIRAELRRMDPLIPMAKVRLMDEYVADALAPNRFALALMLVFAVVASVLAAVGLYGVVAYSLGRKTREVGIRMALGAQRSRIFAGAIREGLAPALVGVGIGLLVSFAMTGAISGLLFGIGSADPLTYATMAGLLVLVALLACLIPARRAVRLDPVIAIRLD